MHRMGGMTVNLDVYRLFWSYIQPGHTPEDLEILKRGGMWMVDQEIQTRQERGQEEDYLVMRRAVGMCNLLDGTPGLANKRRLLAKWVTVEAELDYRCQTYWAMDDMV